MENTITVYQGEHEWLARFKGPYQQQIVGLFGSDTIPTNYPLTTDGSTVCQSVRQAWPGFVILHNEQQGE